MAVVNRLTIVVLGPLHRREQKKKDHYFGNKIVGDVEWHEQNEQEHS